MTTGEQRHKARHVSLHKSLDELVADYFHHTHKMLSSSTIFELLEWSFKQTGEPETTKHRCCAHDDIDNSTTQVKASGNTHEGFMYAWKDKAPEEIHLCEESVHGVFRKCGRFAKFVACTPNGPVYLCEHHSHNFPVEMVKAIIKEEGPREKVQFPEGAIPLHVKDAGPKDRL